MVRPTQGYLTNDGQFYPSAEAAELHEAINEVIGVCETHKFKHHQVFGLVDAAPDTFLRYIYAKKDSAAATFGQEAEQVSGDDTGDEQGSSIGEQVDHTIGDVGDANAPDIDWDKAIYGTTEGRT